MSNTPQLPPIPPGMEKWFEQGSVKYPNPIGQDMWLEPEELTGPARQMFGAWMIWKCEEVGWGSVAVLWREWMEADQ